jgi:hypothetical protein
MDVPHLFYFSLQILSDPFFLDVRHLLSWFYKFYPTRFFWTYDICSADSTSFIRPIFSGRTTFAQLILQVLSDPLFWTYDICSVDSTSFIRPVFSGRTTFAQLILQVLSDPFFLDVRHLFSWFYKFYPTHFLWTYDICSVDSTSFIRPIFSGRTTFAQLILQVLSDPFFLDVRHLLSWFYKFYPTHFLWTYDICSVDSTRFIRPIFCGRTTFAQLILQVLSDPFFLDVRHLFSWFYKSYPTHFFWTYDICFQYCTFSMQLFYTHTDLLITN